MILRNNSIGYLKCANEDSDKNAQIYLNLRLAHMSECTFSNIAAYIVKYGKTFDDCHTAFFYHVRLLG